MVFSMALGVLSRPADQSSAALLLQLCLQVGVLCLELFLPSSEGDECFWLDMFGLCALVALHVFGVSGFLLLRIGLI